MDHPRARSSPGRAALRVLAGLFLPSLFTLLATGLAFLRVGRFPGGEILLGALSIGSLPAMVIGAFLVAATMAEKEGVVRPARLGLWLIITFPTVVAFSWPGCALFYFAGRHAR